MVSFRTEQWNNMTSGVGNSNYLINSTGYAGTTGVGSTQILGTILGLGMQVATTAMTAKQANNSAQNANLVSLAQMSQSALTDISNVNAAISDYGLAKDDLAALQARKANAANIGDMQAQINKYRGSDGSEQAQLIAQHETLINARIEITASINQARGYEQTIAMESAQADVNISASGLSSKVKAENINDMTSPGVVTLVENSYSSADKAEGSELAATYQRDLNVARSIDEQISTRQAARARRDAAQAALNDIATTLPNCEGVAKPQAPITVESISSYLSQVNTKIDELSAQQVNGSDGSQISLATLSDMQGKLTQAQSDKTATGNDSIDAKITAQEKVVNSKKAAAKNALGKLKNTLVSLQPAYNQAINLQREESEMVNAKGSYDTAKAKNNKNRNFIQKIFGRGKSKNVKLANETYKAEKNEYKEAKEAMTQTFSDANAGQIATIINTYNQVQTAIATITRENPELVAS